MLLPHSTMCACCTSATRVLISMLSLNPVTNNANGYTSLLLKIFTPRVIEQSNNCQITQPHFTKEYYSLISHKKQSNHANYSVIMWFCKRCSCYWISLIRISHCLPNKMTQRCFDIVFVRSSFILRTFKEHT